jgi:putative phosphoesterase
MRVAALFDIHGNLPALEAVLADVEAAGADLVVSGGDTVPGPFPRATLALLRASGARLVAVHGNGERNVVDAARGVSPDDPYAVANRWCAEQLTAAELEELARLPLTARVAVDGLGDVLVCHGSPRSDMEIITLVTPDERLAAILDGVSEQLVLAGHTHSQIDRTVGETRFVNPGSVGMPYEHEPGARWALLSAEGVELRRTPYDTEAAAERIRASGFPDADQFAREYVLTLHSPDETAPYFEQMAAEPDQSANSEK